MTTTVRENKARPFTAVNALPQAFLDTLPPRPGFPGGPRPTGTTMRARLTDVHARALTEAVAHLRAAQAAYRDGDHTEGARLEAFSAPFADACRETRPWLVNLVTGGME